MTLLHTSIDSVGIDMQPIKNHNRFWFLFYFIFLVSCSFFMLDLFVGVMIDNFNELKEKNNGNSFSMHTLHHATGDIIFRCR